MSKNQINKYVWLVDTTPTKVTPRNGYSIYTICAINLHNLFVIFAA